MLYLIAVLLGIGIFEIAIVFVFLAAAISRNSDKVDLMNLNIIALAAAVAAIKDSTDNLALVITAENASIDRALAELGPNPDQDQINAFVATLNASRERIANAAQSAQVETGKLDAALGGKLTLTGFDPLQGSAGTDVTLAGTGFTPDAFVSFAGSQGHVPLTDINADATSAHAVVPTDAITGPITVSNPAGAAATSEADFTIV